MAEWPGGTSGGCVLLVMRVIDQAKNGERLRRWWKVEYRRPVGGREDGRYHGFKGMVHGWRQGHARPRVSSARLSWRTVTVV